MTVVSNIHRLLSVSVLCCISLVIPLVTFGQSFENPIQSTSLQAFLESFVRAVTYVLFPILILMMVYTGFLFVKAQGNPAKLSEARSALIWTIVGGIIILGAFAFAHAISVTVTNIIT